MDGEPPAKRARRTDSAAMWSKTDVGGTSPPRASTTDRDYSSRTAQGEDSRNGTYTNRDRKRSRSPREKTRRSRSPRDNKDRDSRGYRERGERGGGGAYDRDRDRVGNRDRSRSRDRDRHRSSRDSKPDARRRSRSPYRTNGTTTRPKVEDRDVKPPPSRDTRTTPITNGKGGPTGISSPKLKLEPAGMDVDDPDDVDVMIKRMMGFASFKSTQNTKVPGNNIYGVRKEKKTEYRQYMNRQGGFNRPLSPGK